MSKKQDDAFDERWNEIQNDPSLTQKQRGNALRDLEEEIYGDPYEEARQEAERDNYSKYLP